MGSSSSPPTQAEFVMMSLISKAILLDGGYFIAKTLMDRDDGKNHSSDNNHQQNDYNYQPEPN